MLKVQLKMQTDAKFDPLKCYDKDTLFSAPVDVQKGASKAKIYEFEVALDGIIKSGPKNALRDINKDEQEGAEVALKGALEFSLELYLFIHLSMYRSAQNDLIKGEFEGSLHCYRKHHKM